MPSIRESSGAAWLALIRAPFNRANQTAWPTSFLRYVATGPAKVASGTSTTSFSALGW